MFKTLANFFALPEDNDPGFVRLARNILMATLATTIALLIVVLASSSMSSSVATLWVLIVSTALEVVALLLILLRGQTWMARIVIPAALIIGVTINALGGNSIHDISIVAYPLIITIAALLHHRFSLIVAVPLTLGAIAFLGFMDMAGFTTNPVSSKTGIDDILVVSVLLLTGTGVLYVLVSRLRHAVAQAEANEKAQVEANRELKELQASLEHRVEERTFELSQRGMELAEVNEKIQRRSAQFEALALVAQTITSVRDLEQLLPQIASVISEKFDFYHVGLFLLDEAREYAVLSAANSAGGRTMLDRKHRLRVGMEGIVGYVTSVGEPRIAMDVGKDPVHFNTPELPNTHSEMALPLWSEGSIVGALDVQSTESGAFTDEDIQTLNLLAQQVSLAIENARLFDETRIALAEAESVSRQFTREAWGRLPVEHNLIGYRYSLTGAAPLSEPIDLTVTDKNKASENPTGTKQIVVPIELRGEPIGSLVVQSPTGDELNPEQLDLIKAVAERVALSAENARLFEETTRRAERERMVSDITGKIRSMNDPQAMIQMAAEELRKALGASRVEVVPQAVTSGK